MHFNINYIVSVPPFCTCFYLCVTSRRHERNATTSHCFSRNCGMQTILCLKDEGDLFPGSECYVVMQISTRLQIIIGIWVLVSMMDFMPDRGEHETDIFATGVLIFVLSPFYILICMY